MCELIHVNQVSAVKQNQVVIFQSTNSHRYGYLKI